ALFFNLETVLSSISTRCSMVIIVYLLRFHLKRVRLHGLDLSTKHTISDIREPEYEKGHVNTQPY
ncbi:hypothetical protein ACXMSV_003603, partial [Salmonella enterica subsp. salamae serovar 42:b:e,n,x,z15]